MRKVCNRKTSFRVFTPQKTIKISFMIASNYNVKISIKEYRLLSLAPKGMHPLCFNNPCYLSLRIPINLNVDFMEYFLFTIKFSTSVIYEHLVLSRLT